MMKISTSNIRKYIDNRTTIVFTMLVLSLLTLIGGKFLISFILIAGSFVLFHFIIEEGSSHSFSELQKLKVLRLFNKDAVIFKIIRDNENYYILTLEKINKDNSVIGKKLYKYFSEGGYAEEKVFESKIIYLNINEEIARLENEIYDFKKKSKVQIIFEHKEVAFAA